MENNLGDAAEAEEDPSFSSVYGYVLYALSLPERTLRGSAAMVGGLVNESAALLVPQAFQNSTTYNKFVQQMMDMLNENVGRVKKKPLAEAEGDDTSSASPNTAVENFVARKTVGTFVDLAGAATLHLSPITVLAIISDVAYGSQVYLKQLASELKKEGVIAEDSTISSTADLLEAIGRASSEATSQLDTPPVSVDGLRDTIRQTTQRISEIDPTKLVPQSEIGALWEDMQVIAAKEDTGLFEISSTLTMYSLNQVSTVTQGALTTVRVTGNLLDQHLLDHYRQGLTRIESEGLYSVIAVSGKPYLDAVWYNFSSSSPTITQDVVSGRLFGKVWSSVSGWFGDPE